MRDMNSPDRGGSEVSDLVFMVQIPRNIRAIHAIGLSERVCGLLDEYGQALSMVLMSSVENIKTALRDPSDENLTAIQRNVRGRE